MRTMYRAMFGLSLAALLASPALAQGRGGRGFGGGGFSMLIANEGVQKELKLDDQQIEKAKEFVAKAREKNTENRSKLEGLEGEEARTKRAEINKEMNEMAMKAFGEFLKPEQITRIKQIHVQSQGIRAFSDPEVTKKLNLTETQKSDIKTISDETMEMLRDVPFGQDQSEEERATNAKKRAEINKGAMEKVASKLNDEQQKTWTELIGSPFTVVFHAGPNNSFEETAQDKLAIQR